MEKRQPPADYSENPNEATDWSDAPPPPETPPKKQRQWLIADIALGLCILNAASALVALIWIYISIRLAALVVIFGAFGLFMVAARRPRLATLFLFFFVLAGFEAIVLEEYIIATLGGEERDVRIAAAPDLHESAIFVFAEGAPRLDMYGRSAMTTKAGDSRTASSYSYVVPYVEEGWTAEMPVRVWASCHVAKAGMIGGERSFVEECGDFGVASKQAVAVPESGFFRAIDDAKEQHHLKTHEHALLVQFVPDPAAYVREKQAVSIRFPIVINGLFVIAILVTGYLLNRKEGAS